MAEEMYFGTVVFRVNSGHQAPGVIDRNGAFARTAHKSSTTRNSWVYFSFRSRYPTTFTYGENTPVLVPTEKTSRQALLWKEYLSVPFSLPGTPAKPR